jgi:AraC family cel operon transcriptional repressor
MPMRLLKGCELFNAYGYHVAETRLTTDAPTFQHAHDFYELFIVSSGRVLHMANGEEQALNEGTLCLVSPEDVHCFRKSGAGEAAFINLAFHPDAYEAACRVFRTFTKEPGRARRVTVPPALRRAFEARVEFLLDAAASSSLLPAGALLMGVLLDALSYLEGFTCSGPEAPLWLTRAMEAMRAPLNAQAGIPRMLQLSGRSQETLCRAMKRFAGVTPSEYVNALRLSIAARLLRSTDRRVLDIQLDCGFDSASHFNQRFKREFGLSPSRYRRQNRAAIDPRGNPGEPQ